MRRAPLALIALAACGPKAEPPPPVPVVVITAPAPGPAPSVASSVVVVVEAPPPAPKKNPYESLPAACRGASLRIAEVAKPCACEWKDCGFDDKREAELRSRLSVTTSAPGEVRGGEAFDVKVRATNTSDEWVLVVLDRDRRVDSSWLDDHAVAVPSSTDKSCKPVAAVSMIRAAAVALAPGGVLEGTTTVRATRKRMVGPKWKPRDASERKTIADLEEWDCAPVDDGPLKKGSYAVRATLPFAPMSLETFARASAPVEVR